MNVNSRRVGFTLIELLVVIAIIAVLVGLLVPAVQKVREAANRMSCSNNLKQLGLAIHSHNDTFGRFPPGFADLQNQIANPTNFGPGWGWASHLLPFIEQDNAFKSIRFDKSIADPLNAQVRGSIIKTFLCPSDNHTQAFQTDGNGVMVGPSNYVGMFGSREMPDDPGRGEGVFFRNSRIRLADLVDGSSNTLLVGERNSRLCKSTWTGFVLGAVTFPAGEPDEAEQPYALILGHTGINDPSDPPHTPNGSDLHAEDFASNHTSGVNFLQGDGSVRMIKSTIRPAAWVALGTRAGGEVVQDD